MQNYKNEFFLEVIEKRKLLDKNYNDTWLLLNMEGTPVYWDMFSKTKIDFIEAENISIVIDGREKYRISALLAICANGWRLPPLVVVKGERGKK